MEHLDEFNVLSGFKFREAYRKIETSCIGIKSEVVTIRFCNEKKVGIDVDFVEGEPHISEPYAINEDFEPIK